MTILCDLAAKYGTDKGVTGHPVSRRYTAVYAELMRFPIRTLLEIGIYEGWSLHMWEEYLPEAQIYGIDSDTSRLINTDRIHSYYANQNNSESMVAAIENMGKPMDFIVDDGSHELAHQISSANILVPYLTDNGVYVIEDIRTTDIPFVRGSVKFPSHTIRTGVLDTSNLIIIHAPKESAHR